MNNNMAVYQHKKFAKPSEEELSHQNIGQLPQQKRKRDEHEDHSEIDNARMSCTQQSTKRRQAKSIFRPWSDTEETTTVKVAKTSPKANIHKVAYQSPNPLPQAPAIMSTYQLALQHQNAMVMQHQHQTAMVMQQAAMYQRQMMLAHLWARQQQQQQHFQMQHHIRQQQLFAFGSQQ